MFKAFIKDSAIYAVPAFVSRGLSLLLLPIYTRVLSPEDYGSLDLLTVFASLVSLTVALEVSQGVARFYPAEADIQRKFAYASSAFWFTLFCYALFSAIALANSHLLSDWVMGREGLRQEFQIGIAYIGFNGLCYLIQAQFRWELRSRGYAAVSLWVTLSTAIVAVGLTYGLQLGLKGLLLGMLSGSIIGVGYGLWHLRDSIGFRFDGSCLKEMLVFSAPLVPSGLAVFVSTYIDRIMINYFLSVEAVGLYGIGFRVASALGLVLIGFRGALTPLVYSHYREPDTPYQLARIFRVFITIALLLYLALAFFSHELLVLISTPEYYSSAQLIVFLAPAILLSQMYIFAPGPGIARKTFLILYINLGGALLNTIFNWLLIPLLDVRGAALATFLGYCCVFSVYMLFSQRLYRVPHDWSRLAFATFFIFALAWIVPESGLQGMPRWILNAAAWCFGASIIIAAGLVRLSELGQFSSLLATKWRQYRARF